MSQHLKEPERSLLAWIMSNHLQVVRWWKQWIWLTRGKGTAINPLLRYSQETVSSESHQSKLEKGKKITKGSAFSSYMIKTLFV